MNKTVKIIHVVGVRPNFIKIASVLRACAKVPEIESLLIHTGQHYREDMNQVFFDELGIPRPHINLEVGSGSHAQQTAEIMKRFEPVLLECNPDAILVVGDVNSTLACTLVATKLGVKVVHVEAGLRSFDRSMPEEINRILTDAVSDLLFVSEPSGLTNLRNEGIDGTRVHFVGNVMIDTLEFCRTKAQQSRILEQLNLHPRKYVVLTLHRPRNVDDHLAFAQILDAVEEIQKYVKVIFPVHPRTYMNLKGNGLSERIGNLPNIILTRPLGYLDFIRLMSEAGLVLTDSGGIQEETTILGIPCLTLRENTERPITITEGTNVLVGTDKHRILTAYQKSFRMVPPGTRPKYWDGKAAERIVHVMVNSLQSSDKKHFNNDS